MSTTPRSRPWFHASSRSSSPSARDRARGRAAAGFRAGGRATHAGGARTRGGASAGATPGPSPPFNYSPAAPAGRPRGTSFRTAFPSRLRAGPFLLAVALPAGRVPQLEVVVDADQDDL